ncbi:TldD/PmbA family protein [Candidatus Woesearchaeota archaeon]|nr:TldD/PmbA family protein [Candidatus Woesearchaeota archaeon]
MVNDITAQKGLLSKLVSTLEAVVPYSDALYSEHRTSGFVKDSTGIEMHADADVGVKIRAFDGRKFHEICIHGWQPDILQKEVQLLARKLKEDIPSKKITLQVDKKRVDKDFSTEPEEDFRDVSMEDKATLMENLHKKVSGDKAFIECQIALRETEEHKIFVNKFKRLSSSWTGCSLTVIPIVKTDDGTTRSEFFRRFRSGFEAARVPEENLDAFLERAKKLAKAKRIEPGAYTCVLSPIVSGLLAHESFGHGMESDTIAHGRAKAAEYLGKRIAPAKVTIVEDPSIDGAHGSLFFDDEGMLPQPVNLVERGIVRDPITEILSGSAGGFRRSANGRAEAFDRKVYARMTNTFFASGKDTPEKMIKSVKNGIYIHQGSAGMEDPKGWGVQISGLLCERIKNGKLTGEIYDEVTMGGYLPDILKNIKAVGKDFEIQDDAGFCGKGHKEWVRVASGGPHLLIEKVELS